MDKSILRRVIKIQFLLLFFVWNLFAQVTDSSLIIGNFEISKVIDGDTFKFEGLESSTRLLCLDTEETFKGKNAKQNTEEISRFWEKFYQSEKGDRIFPAKTDSPFGYETWKWAEEFFEDVDYVRLEKDDNDRTIDIFGRYLVYVIAIKNGKEVNYNVECVKNGYSPYFNKYGNSKRFHDQFVKAQEYAKKNKLGIWDSEKQHYPDYPERIEWWNKRAAQLENFDKKYKNNPDYFNISNDKDFDRLKNYLGKEVVIFGGIGEVLTKKFPYLIRLSHNRTDYMDVVVFEKNKDILNKLNLKYNKEFYSYFKGVLKEYKGTFQIILENENQFWVE